MMRFIATDIVTRNIPTGRVGRRAVMMAAGLTTILLAGLSTGAAAQTVLKYSDHDPLGGMRTQFNKDVWLPEIEKQTNGAVKIQDFWGGALLGSKEILKGVGDGVVDMGFAFPGHYPKQLLSFNIFSLFPRGPEKFSDMVRLWRRAIDEIPEFQAELDRANVVVVNLSAGLPGAFTGKKPLDGLADIKGDKWRAGGKWLLRYLGNAGAEPVAVPWGDTYMALQTGAIDGVFTNYDGLHMMKFDEVAPNLLISKQLWFAMPFLHLMNKDRFNALPADVRDGILKAGAVAEEQFGAVYEAAFEKVRAEQVAAGFTVKELSDADVVAWENQSELAKLQAEWVDEAKAAGLANAAEVMEKMRALHAEIVGN